LVDLPRRRKQGGLLGEIDGVKVDRMGVDGYAEDRTHRRATPTDGDCHTAALTHLASGLGTCVGRCRPLTRGGGSRRNGRGARRQQQAGNHEDAAQPSGCSSALQVRIAHVLLQARTRPGVRMRGLAEVRLKPT
jgi:hypothetical protein